MAESAFYRTRLLPPGTLAPLLLWSGTAAMAAVVATSWVVPPVLSAPVLLGAILVLVRRANVEAEYEVGPDGLRERFTLVGSGAVRERRWAWGEIRSYTLDTHAGRSPAARKVLVVRLPAHRLRLREPDDAEARNAHARFVDRFVGYATGDVSTGAGLPAERPRPERPHRQPLSSIEAPQLRRTMTHQAVPRPTARVVPLLDRPAGRLLAGVGALALLGLMLLALLLGPTLGPWSRFALVGLPAAVFLGWRALRGGG